MDETPIRSASAPSSVLPKTESRSKISNCTTMRAPIGWYCFRRATRSKWQPGKPWRSRADWLLPSNAPNTSGKATSDLRDDLLAEAADVIEHLLAFAHKTRDGVGGAEVPEASVVVRAAGGDVHDMNFEIGPLQGAILLAVRIQPAD